ncbi:MAG: GMC family oxidoreductase [Polyangiales bacterium]
MSAVVHDVVVVGAGVAGALTADVLARAGLRVLILDAGTGDELRPEGWRDAVTRMHGALMKVPNAPFAKNRAVPSPDLAEVFLGLEGYFAQRGPLPFASDYLRATGGTTLHWLGSCPRMLPSDFAMRSRFGVGVDWPLAYDDLLPWYAAAERSLGVSGDVASQQRDGVTFEDGYVYPMRAIPQSWLDQRIATAVASVTLDVDGEPRPLALVSTPQARNGVPDPAYDRGRSYLPVGAGDGSRRGERCVGSASCVPICPVEARYSAARTLRRLPARAEIRARSVATRVEHDPETGRVTGVRVVAYGPDGEAAGESVARGKAYVLACNAVENATLLLASGLCATSGELGRNLMDHPYLLACALAREDLGPFRGPSSTSNIAGIRDGAFRARAAASLIEVENWGWHVATGAPHTQVEALIARGLHGRDLRARVAAELSRQLGLGFLVEQLPEAGNRVAVDPSLRTPLGGHRPVLHYDLSPYTRAGLALAARAARTIFGAVGAADTTAWRKGDPRYVEHEGEGFVYRGAGHLAGTHRMGRSPRDSVVDANQRAWDHDNLYVVGAGSMPTMGTANPTLTLAALCLRTADHLARGLA